MSFALLLALAPGVALAQYASTPSAVQTPSQAQTLEAVKAAPKRGVFFEAVRGDRTVYLFGTVHAGKVSWYPLPLEVMAAAASSAAMAFEVDLADPERLAVIEELGQYPQAAQAPAARISPTLRKVLERNKLSGPEAARIRPWLLALSVDSLALADGGYDLTASTEAFFFGFARAQKKKVVALESVRSQFAIFAGLDEADQRALLEEAAASTEDGRFQRSITDLMKAWTEANAPGLERSRGSLAARGPASTKVDGLLYGARDAALAARIEELNETHSPLFVAIGAFHLLGSDSVTAALEKHGYVVRPR